MTLHHEQALVVARQLAARLAALLGFEAADETRIATAVSEIARNAFRYAAGGDVAFALDREASRPELVVTVTDRGPGIAALDDVLSGGYRSSTGAGTGIAGARRLMDRLTIASTRGHGTTVTMRKTLPAGAPPLTAERIESVRRALASRASATLIAEFERQNQELLRALGELQTRQEELARLNRELEDTNRGVVALYAELDDRAEHLRRASDLKSRFLSNSTHEFRTPVNAILGLCDLLDRRGAFEETGFIRQAARDLRELIDDLLDLAKVEAGRTTVRAEPLVVADLFGALRGMLKPLLRNQSVALTFDADPGLPEMVTDGAKVSQILRNLIANALKFTDRGEVRVTARPSRAGIVEFAVADTGRGIAPELHAAIFEEFAQIEQPSGGEGGSGLGLPLARRLAELLGGSLTVDSTPGLGSVFTLTLPRDVSGENATTPQLPTPK